MQNRHVDLTSELDDQRSAIARSFAEKFVRNPRPPHSGTLSDYYPHTGPHQKGRIQGRHVGVGDPRWKRQVELYSIWRGWIGDDIDGAWTEALRRVEEGGYDLSRPHIKLTSALECLARGEAPSERVSAVTGEPREAYRPLAEAFLNALCDGRDGDVWRWKGIDIARLNDGQIELSI